MQTSSDPQIARRKFLSMKIGFDFVQDDLPIMVYPLDFLITFAKDLTWFTRLLVKVALN